MKSRIFFIVFLLLTVVYKPFSQEEAHGHDSHAAFDPGATALHHISDANVYSILDFIRIPLPVILKSDAGWDIFSSSRFSVGAHEDGTHAYNGYVMHHGSVYRVNDHGFPMNGQARIDGFSTKVEKVNGKDKDIHYVLYQARSYRLDARSTLDGGILGGGITSFMDFSPTKNVISMILVSLLLFWLFRKAAVAYKNNPDRAPKGVQGVLEPLVIFIRDDVAVPFLGKNYKKYFPFLLSLFFFILGLNLFGQIPFLGGSNITGSLTVTMVLAIIVFIVVNINGNKHYWSHIFWMPGVPIPIRILLAGVEVMGLFIKPLTLMLRLAGNISAGHIAVLSFIGLIFIFGKSGESLAGSTVGTFLSVPLTMFMMTIELIVAFVQAFVFTILAASYIGAAIEEVDHDHVESIHH